MLSAVFWGELIDKFITIDTKFFNKYIKALFINHCDVIHSIFISGLSVKALAGPCRTEPTIVTEVGLRRITIFGTGFYNLIKSEVNIDEL